MFRACIYCTYNGQNIDHSGLTSGVGLCPFKIVQLCFQDKLLLIILLGYYNIRDSEVLGAFYWSEWLGYRKCIT